MLATRQPCHRIAESTPILSQAGEGLQGTAEKAGQKAPEAGGKLEDGIRSGADQTKDKAPQAGGKAGEVRLCRASKRS